MSLYKRLNTPVDLSGLNPFNSVPGKTLFIWFCSFWLLVAVLELGQDYVSSILNENYFRIGESLAYKLFWILFIPFTITLIYSLEKTKVHFSQTLYLLWSVVFVIMTILLHLFVFSFILFRISDLIHEDPWSLVYLITEKLSTRLYISIAVYSTLTALYLFFKRKGSDKKNKQIKKIKTIKVKNGHRSVLVPTEDIKLIKSDGAYLEIHTEDKMHVILDSLKNMTEILPENFRRIHRSTIVNMDHISELRSRGNGDYDVIMDDKNKLRLSRNYTKPLKGTLL